MESGYIIYVDNSIITSSLKYPHLPISPSPHLPISPSPHLPQPYNKYSTGFDISPKISISWAKAQLQTNI